MKRAKPSAIALVSSSLLMLAACESSPSGPESGSDFDPSSTSYAVVDQGAGAALRAEAEAFVPGGAMNLILENSSDEPLGYNLCFHALERREGTDWTLLTHPRVCTLELRIVQPGASGIQATTLPNELEPGEYRVRAAVSFMESEEARGVLSNVFQVSP